MVSSISLLLRADSLQVRRGADWCSEDVNLLLREGSQLFLEGANGSGKSTVLRAVAGVYADYSGRCARYAPVTYIGHHCGYKDTLSARQNMLWYCALWDTPTTQINASLAAFGLEAFVDRPLGQLSAGQRQRAALARLSLSKAPIWLLDEPESSLDKDARALLEQMCEQHLARGGGVVRTRPSTGILRARSDKPIAVHTQHADGQVTRKRHGGATPSRGFLSKGASFFWFLCRRDSYLLWRQHHVWRMPLLLLLAASVPALVLVFDEASLRQMASVLFWSLTLLIMFSGGDELCARDREDDTLAQLCLAPIPLWQAALARIVAVWWTLALPMVLMALPVALLLGLSMHAAYALMCGLLLGSPALAALSAMTASLIAPLGGRATLGAMLSLPLALPILLFGIITTELAMLGLSILPSLALLAAFSMGACMLLPHIIAMGWQAVSSV